MFNIGGLKTDEIGPSSLLPLTLSGRQASSQGLSQALMEEMNQGMDVSDLTR